MIASRRATSNILRFVLHMIYYIGSSTIPLFFIDLPSIERERSNMKFLPFPTKDNTPDLLDRKIIIFGDAVLFDFIAIHITDILSGNLPKMTLDQSSDIYISDDIRHMIVKAYLDNKETHPNEAFSNWEELKAMNIPTHLVGFSTKNTTVMDILLKSDDYVAKIGLSGNVNLPTEYLIRLLAAKDTDQIIRIGIAKHKNLTKDVLKLFVNETSYFVIDTLSRRKDIIDDNVLEYFKQYGSQFIKEEFDSKHE